MSEQTHNFADPFEEHVFFMLLVACSRCEQVLHFGSPEAEISSDWISGYARKMKDQHWLVPPDNIWLALCPQCKPFEAELRHRMELPEWLQFKLRCRDSRAYE